MYMYIYSTPHCPFLGKGMKSLKELEYKCESSSSIDLVGLEGRKLSGAKLFVRLREPLTGEPWIADIQNSDHDSSFHLKIFSYDV